MVSAEENELLTRIGPGTRMGSLLRRYWWPFAPAASVADRWTLSVRLLGEDLVLYRTRNGSLGLIGERCPHRGASLAYGIPTEGGIRCPYHGWEFDGSGRCVQQPNEPSTSTFKDKIATAGYPVQELGGLLFAYMGPAPAPLIPRFAPFVVPDAIRLVGKQMIPCNWLQIMENSLDPVHAEWLHGALYEFVKEGSGERVASSRHHVKIDFDEFEYGIYKRRLLEGQSEDADDWTVGHPLIFPNILANGNANPKSRNYGFQIRVPVDDEHTLHLHYSALIPPDGTFVPPHLLQKVWAYDVPFLDENGDYTLDMIDSQDVMALVSQGTIADRALERLGTTDVGILMYRRMLLRELNAVERGEDPKGVIRDPARNGIIEYNVEKAKHSYSDGFASNARRSRIRYSPIVDELIEVFSDVAESLHPSR